jgi:hypothetical protein
MDTHMLIAVTIHPDGSQSSRIWTPTRAALDAITAPLGEPAAHTHLDASSPHDRR